jgi:hypothetical protein
LCEEGDGDHGRPDPHLPIAKPRVLRVALALDDLIATPPCRQRTKRNRVGGARSGEREVGEGFRVKRSTSEMVSSRRCLMECGSRRLAFFGVAFAGVPAAPSLAIGAVG